MGASLGALFAGDYLTLFIFWEVMAFSSVFLVWYRKEQRSIDAGYRYLLVHVFGGLLFFTGMMLYYAKTGSLAFEHILPANAGLAEYLILAGFCSQRGRITSPRLAAGCLSRGDGGGCGVHVRLYDKNGRLCPCQGVCRI